MVSFFIYSDSRRFWNSHVNTLYRWVSEFKSHGNEAFPGNGNLKPEDAEIRKLKKELDDLREENAILKKAIRIFTKPGN